MMNKDWLEKQAAKRASQEVAERVAAEQAAAQEAAEAAGVQYKRGRGRPVGSKTRNHRAGMADLPPAETAQEVGVLGRASEQAGWGTLVPKHVWLARCAPGIRCAQPTAF
jgi:hypothetical protein